MERSTTLSDEKQGDFSPSLQYNYTSLRILTEDAVFAYDHHRNGSTDLNHAK